MNTSSCREDSGVYALTVSNPSGTDTATVNVTVLGKSRPPQGPLDAYDVTAEHITIKWQKPEDDGGSPVSHYIIEIMDSSKSLSGKSCEK